MKVSNYHNYKYQQKNLKQQNTISSEQIRETLKMLKYSSLIKKVINLKNDRLRNLNLSHVAKEGSIEFRVLEFDLKVKFSQKIRQHLVYKNNAKLNLDGIKSINFQLKEFFSDISDLNKIINNVKDFFQYSEKEIDFENTIPPKPKYMRVKHFFTSPGVYIREIDNVIAVFDRTFIGAGRADGAGRYYSAEIFQRALENYYARIE